MAKHKKQEKQKRVAAAQQMCGGLCARHRGVVFVRVQPEAEGIREPILTWVSRNADPIPTKPEGRGKKRRVLCLSWWRALLGEFALIIFWVVFHLPSDPMLMIIAGRYLTHCDASLPRRQRSQPGWPRGAWRGSPPRW
jgi:hypothetical protein